MADIEMSFQINGTVQLNCRVLGRSFASEGNASLPFLNTRLKTIPFRIQDHTVCPCTCRMQRSEGHHITQVHVGLAVEHSASSVGCNANC